MTKTKSLHELTAELGKAYKTWKSGETSKDNLRKDFFQSVTDRYANSKGELEERYVVVDGTDLDVAEAKLRQKYPRWDILDIRVDEGYPDRFEAIIVERPEFKPYTFVNPTDGMVYTKQVSAGSIYVDDERLAQENPDLWEKVSYVPEPERQLRSLDDLAPDVLAELAEYMYEGPPKVSLPAPRKAKPEELE